MYGADSSRKSEINLEFKIVRMCNLGHLYVPRDAVKLVKERDRSGDDESGTIPRGS